MPGDCKNNTRTCQRCGKVMVGVSYNRKWCSSACGRAAHKTVPSEKKDYIGYKPIDSKNCNDCHYWRLVSGELHGCHYIFMTGKKRPCPPGKGCTVKVKREVHRRKAKENE